MKKIGRALTRIGMRSLSLAAAMLVLLAPATSAGADPGGDCVSRDRQSRPRSATPTIGSCTMAVPPTQATVEAEIATLRLLPSSSRTALAGDVFRAR